MASYGNWNDCRCWFSGRTYMLVCGEGLFETMSGENQGLMSSDKTKLVYHYKLVT